MLRQTKRGASFCGSLVACMVLIGLSSTPTALRAGDWPQILGPHRNGEAEKETLADSWPSDGPRTVWQRPVGRGYAGLAVVGPTGVLFHRVEDEERVEAIDVATGKERWHFAIPTSYTSGISPDDGPRCVPIIHGDQVVVFGVQGTLACVRLADGANVWSQNTHAEFRATEGYFGAGSSPIVEGDKVIVNVGGAKTGAGVVAFSLSSGKVLWKVGREDASYSSPVAVTVGGTRHLIVETRLTTYSFDPETGKIRFQFPFGQRGPTVNGANPTVIGDHLFLTASYGVGAVYGRIHDASFDTLWASDDVLSTQYATCIADRGLLYGISGRDDVGPGEPPPDRSREPKDRVGESRLRLRHADQGGRQAHRPEDRWRPGADPLQSRALRGAGLGPDFHRQDICPTRPLEWPSIRPRRAYAEMSRPQSVTRWHAGCTSTIYALFDGKMMPNGNRRPSGRGEIETCLCRKSP